MEIVSPHQREANPAKGGWGLKKIQTVMEIGGKKVLIIGGHVLTALQIAEIRRVCEKARLEFQNVVGAMDRMAVISQQATTTVKDLIELASIATCKPSFIPSRPKMSRTSKEQHKRAMRYHGKR